MKALPSSFVRVTNITKCGSPARTERATGTLFVRIALLKSVWLGVVRGSELAGPGEC